MSKGESTESVVVYAKVEKRSDLNNGALREIRFVESLHEHICSSKIHLE